MSNVDTCNSPVTIALPFSSLIKPVSFLWPIVSPLISIFAVLTLAPVIVPVVVIAFSVEIVPNPEEIEPADNAPTVVKLAFPAIAEYVLAASVAASLESIWVWISDVTPLEKLSLAAGVVNPVILFILADVAVIAVPSSLSDVALNCPSTANTPVFRVIRLASPSIPIVEPVTLTFPASRVPAVTFPVVVIAVVISTPSKAPTNLPADRFPTVVIEELPAFTEYLLSAEVSVILSSSWVWISEVTLLVKLILAAGAVMSPNNSRSDVVTPELCSTLSSAAVVFTVELLILRPVTPNVPSTETFPAESVKSVVSPDTPMLEAPTTTEPILALAADTALLPTSIFPKPSAIEPEVNAPTVVIVLAPLILAYVVAAVALANLASTWVCISASIFANLLMSAVPTVTPASLLSSAALAVTSVPDICNLLVFTSPDAP